MRIIGEGYYLNGYYAFASVVSISKNLTSDTQVKIMKLGKLFLDSDLIEEILLFVLGLIIIFYSISMPGFGKTVLSPGLFPSIVGVLLAVLSLVRMIESLLAQNQKGRDKELREKSLTFRNMVLVLISLGITIFYIWALPILHFVAATIIFLFIFFIYVGERRLWLVATLSIGATGMFYLVFRVLLRVILP